MPPAETVLQRLRQVPMVQRHIRRDAVRQQFVQQPIIEVETLRVRRAVPVRKHARPRNRETIGLDAQILDQANVFLVAMIVIVGLIGIAAVFDLARLMGESIPDRAAASVFKHGALDLIGGRRRPPDETVRKAGGGAGSPLWFGPALLRFCRLHRHGDRGQTRELRKASARKLGGHRLSVRFNCSESASRSAQNPSRRFGLDEACSIVLSYSSVHAHRYRPLNLGFRRSRNAATPSL